MKKAVKVLLGIVAAGAAASAAVVAVKKHRNRHEDFVFEKDDPFEEDEEYSEDDLGDDEYSLTPEEEEELIVTDDYDFGTDAPLAEDDDSDMDRFIEEHTAPVRRRGTYLTADQVDFIRFMMKGISNIGTIMDGRISDVERICRRHITAAEKVNDIRNLCLEHDDSKDLLDLCISDIREVLSGGYPHDYFDYVKDRKDGKCDGE